MDTWMQGLEPVVEHQDLRVPYRYSMGATTSRFFIEIRDHRKILGIKCPKCKVVFVPPRSVCGRCFSPLDNWVEVGDRGTVQTYTIVHYPSAVQPVPTPLIYGIIKLDGADTGLAHLINETDYEKLRVGMRVQAVFKEERVGNMLDILYFKPIPTKDRKSQVASRKSQSPKRKAQVVRRSEQRRMEHSAERIANTKGRKSQVVKRKSHSARRKP
jgi:uncharacterized OB-fold protein